VDASEGEGQIARYQAWLRKQRQPTNGQHLLVFLTPEGRKPQTGNPDDVRCVSYRQPEDWVSSLLPELPERLRTVLIQYRENCHIIGGDRRYSMSMDDELRKFLTEPSSLDTALEVAEAVETIRLEIFEQFWGQVKAQLSAKLKCHGYQRQWKVHGDFVASCPYLGIYWNHHNWKFFAVAFESLTGTSYPAYYGIWRGKKIQARALAAQLRGAFVTDEDDWWVGWQYLHELGLPEFRITKKEDVLKLSEDNSNPDHPLADQLASLLWDLFDRHRKELEDLNENHPY
jgi:hypothetical protein